jgi:hypothetical protein
MCFPCLFSEAVDQGLQMCALRALLSVWERCADFRPVFLEELLQRLGSLPRHATRAYRLLDEGKSVHVATALVLLCLQSCSPGSAAAPSIDMDVSATDSQQSAAGTSPSPSAAFNTAVAVAKAFCGSLLSKYAS